VCSSRPIGRRLAEPKMAHFCPPLQSIQSRPIQSTNPSAKPATSVYSKGLGRLWIGRLDWTGLVLIQGTFLTLQARLAGEAPSGALPPSSCPKRDLNLWLQTTVRVVAGGFAAPSCVGPSSVSGESCRWLREAENCGTVSGHRKINSDDLVWITMRPASAGGVARVRDPAHGLRS
jgi:hypothetical protein